MHSISYALALAVAVLFFHGSGRAADPVDNKKVDLERSFGKLQLLGGDVYRGEFGKSQNGDGSLIWKCPSFITDLVVPWNAVDSVFQPLDGQKAADEPEVTQFVVELQNGEALTGKVLDINDQFVVVEGKLAGKKSLPTSSIRSILRASKFSESQNGELKVSDWKQVTPSMKKGGRSNWFEGLGSYDTETAGTTISQAVQFPDLAAIDINVAWQSASPNWLVQIGEPRRLEVHVRKLENRNTLSMTVLVEDDTTADIATAQVPVDGSNSIFLRVLCDSVRGRLVVIQNGIAIAQLRLNKSLRLTGRQSVLFTNNVPGRLSLRSLKINRSIFSAPVYMPNGKEPADNGNIKTPETLMQNGETFVGQPMGFDPANQTFGFPSSAEVLGRVSLEQVDRIEFPSEPEEALRSVESQLYSVQLWSGDRFVGQSISFKPDRLHISLTQSKLVAEIPLQQVMSIGQSGPAKPVLSKQEQDNSSSLLMRFVSPWCVSKGSVVDMENMEQGLEPKLVFRTLNWKPANAASSVAITANVTGTIESLSIPPKIDKPVAPRPGADIGRTLEKDEPSLFLKSGDCFSAEIQSIQDGELFFQSNLFNTKKIDVELVRGIRKLAYTGADSMEKLSRKRLMTLPRAQRSNPPKHLVVSREGDAVRGHLLSMDQDTLSLEIRGEERKIQMKSVAEIIWLQDAPEIVPIGKSETKELIPVVDLQANSKEANNDLQCQALDSSGTRISIVPIRVEGNVLLGQHPQLGECHVDLANVSKLVLGAAIADDAKRNRFGKWTLENAPDPKFVNDLDSPDVEGGITATSPQARLVGQMAPDFELQKLDGKSLKLSELRGRIVILDFWATWCGPCVASLPKLTEMSQEYKGADVDLIAVNIEQTSAEVRSLLDRLKISPLVVLDTDGAVARAYQAQAIPQTVLIDPDGKIHQVFVGGGGDIETKIRESLDGMLNLRL